MNRRLVQYSRAGHRTVQGWLTDTAVDVLLALGAAQAALEVHGPVCEIGVHHGRFFILLHLLTRTGEHSVAWDLFERQDENVDRSGRGDREQLMENLRRHGCQLDRIGIHTQNSLRLSAGAIVSACQGRPRIFSIDGGHTVDVTVNDLTLAAQSIQEGALVVLDDFFNEAWPGVAEGTCAFMASSPGRLSPVVIAGNKFVFTGSRGWATRYRDAIVLPPAAYARRQSTAFGEDVLVVLPRPKTAIRSVLRTRAWRAVRDTAAGKALRTLVRFPRDRPA